MLLYGISSTVSYIWKTYPIWSSMTIVSKRSKINEMCVRDQLDREMAKGKVLSLSLSLSLFQNHSMCINHLPLPIAGERR